MTKINLLSEEIDPRMMKIHLLGKEIGLCFVCRMLASGNYVLPLWPGACERRTGPAPHPVHAPPTPCPLVNIGKFVRSVSYGFSWSPLL